MHTAAATAPRASWAERIDLFLVSWLILFLELACIRWFPAHVLFLTFFTNIVLLACFVGMSVGCLAARSRWNWITWTPWLLLLALVAGHGVEYLWREHDIVTDVGQRDPQVIFFGAERGKSDPASFFIPVELMGGGFFLLLALVFVGPGQELGRALERVPDRVGAYTINIFGSVVGILTFMLCSEKQLSPLWWFLLASIGLLNLLLRLPYSEGQRRHWLVPRLAGGALFLATAVAATPGSGGAREHFWSPYYRVDYNGSDQIIDTNMISHQVMHSTDSTFPAYALPYLWERDSGTGADDPTQPHPLDVLKRGTGGAGVAAYPPTHAPFKKVLIIGAGSGNDVSRALQFGAHHVDAVEIDPVMYQIGKRDHPNHPYSDRRVHVHLDDGRNVLHSSGEAEYDLVVYALVDSLVLHSSYSNIRLESYLFTREAFQDVKRCLKPGGKFYMYNYFRHGWLAARINNVLAEVFGEKSPTGEFIPEPPVVVPLGGFGPIHPQDELKWQLTMFVAGNKESLDPLRKKFDKGMYWLPRDQGPSPATRNGFTRRDIPTATPPAEPKPRGDWLEKQGWFAFEAVQVDPEKQANLKPASDDWPFLYLHEPEVPIQSWRGMGIMGGLALLLIVAFYPRGQQQGGTLGSDVRMCFLGAGFMLVETKAVVHMALLFGSTWFVNSIVFLAVLVMILVANLFVLLVKPKSILPYAVGLFVTLALNFFIPLEWFLGMSRAAQVGLSCLLVFSPILFAAVVFAQSFAQTPAADRAFGANIAGAMLGGLAENASMVLGFQKLILVAAAFYLVALLGRMPALAAKPAAGTE